MKRILMKIFGPRARQTTAGAIAKQFGLELRGDPKAVIRGVAPIAEAKAGEASFYSTERNSTAFKILPIDVLKNTKASIILVQPENVIYAPEGATLLITDSPRNQVVKILDFIYAEPRKHGISYDSIIASGVYFRKKKSVYVAPFAVIEKGAVIEENVQIMPGAYIGRNCIIGKNTIIYQNAVIQNATIGEDCVIYSGASIGKDGFGYTRQDGKNIFIQHAGRVIIGNRVSIGANSCVDRGALTDTKIGDGTKIDNLVQIAHGVIIGKECFAAAGVGIAGMAVIEDGAMLGGNVGVANKVRVGAHAEVGAKSGLMRDVPAGEKWFGYPAFPATESLRMTAWLNKQIKGKKNG